MVRLLIVFALLISGCSSHNDAVKSLEAAGYTNIKTHGYSFFGCSEGNDFSTKFTAKNQNGKTINGAVCSGWFKGGVIRYE